MASNVIPQAKGHVYGARNMGKIVEVIEQCVRLVVFLSNLERVKVEFGKMDFLERVGVKTPVQNGA